MKVLFSVRIGQIAIFYVIIININYNKTAAEIIGK